MVKLLFVDHTPFVGGAQLVLAEHISALNKNEFEVYVACTDAVPEMVHKFEGAGAKVVVVPMPKLRGAGFSILAEFWRSINSIRRIVNDHHIDLVVTNTTRASYVATLAVVATKTKLIWWVRDFLYPKLLFKILSWRTDKVIFVSKAVRDFYHFQGNPKADVLYVASNLYLSLASITEQQIEAERSLYGFGPQDVVVGFMGRLVEEKGAQDVVAAIAKLHPRYPQLKLLLVGTGHGQMHDIEPELKSIIDEQQLAEVVKMAGYKTNEALYYSMFDIFVLATRDHEPYATSVVQAMMAGKPVIGSNAGGTPELVNDGQTGWLYEPGDVDGLANVIKMVIDNPKSASTIAETGNRHVLEFNREEQLAANAEALYRQVISQ